MLILVAVIAVVAVTLLVAFKVRPAPATQRPRERIVVDHVGVTRIAGERVEKVTWDELLGVDVVTTDRGPFVEDFFFVLHGGDGRGCVVAQLLADELLPRLQALPGFDNVALIRALGSTENARFLCWRRPGLR
jgi:hypothetical protein